MLYIFVTILIMSSPQCIESAYQNFLMQSRLKYKNRFEYFGGYTTKVDVIKIRCVEHDKVFPINPAEHLDYDSGGCPECFKSIKKIASTGTTTDFVKKSKFLFGEKFDYSNVTYVDSTTHVNLTCKLHPKKNVNITPNRHYITVCGGCLPCGKKNKTSKSPITIEDIKKKIDEYAKLQSAKKNVKKIKSNCIDCNVHLTIEEGNKNPLCKICKMVNTKVKIDDNGYVNIPDDLKCALDLKEDELIRRVPIDGLNKYYASTRGRLFTKNLRPICGIKTAEGYMATHLKCNGLDSSWRVHRIICTTFKPNTEKKPFVDHINHDRSDNNISNLRWATKEENAMNHLPNGESIYAQENEKIRKHYTDLKKNDEKFKAIENSKECGDINTEKYVISNYGRIMNKRSGLMLSPNVRGEYFTVNLSDTGYPKSVSIHRVVAEQFIGPSPPGKYHINHRNGIKYDNDYRNLTWVTLEQNNQHAHCQSLNMIDDNGNIVETFNSKGDASKHFGKSRDFFSSSKNQRAIKNGEKIEGFIFQNVDLKEEMDDEFRKHNHAHIEGYKVSEESSDGTSEYEEIINVVRILEIIKIMDEMGNLITVLNGNYDRIMLILNAYIKHIDQYPVHNDEKQLSEIHGMAITYHNKIVVVHKMYETILSMWMEFQEQNGSEILNM